MKKTLIIVACLLVAVLCFTTACESAAPATSATSGSGTSASAANSDELYILVSALSTYDMFEVNDFYAFEEWGKLMGVQTQITGPPDWDMVAMASAIDQAAAQKPDGLLVAGFDPTLQPSIDAAMDAGIPVVLYDSDVPESKRLSFSGTDWASIGRIQAMALGEAMGGQGKVAYIGIVGMSIMEMAFAAFEETMAENFPAVEVMEKYDNPASVEEATKLAADIITANPDLTGFAGFASTVGPGIGIAIKEANKVGEIKLTCVDMEPQHLQLIEDGIATLLVGQKRKLFTWYGAQMLYDYVHGFNSFSLDDKAAGISTIPARVDTGLVLVDKNNISFFLE